MEATHKLVINYTDVETVELLEYDLIRPYYVVINGLLVRNRLPIYVLYEDTKYLMEEMLQKIAAHSKLQGKEEIQIITERYNRFTVNPARAYEECIRALLAPPTCLGEHLQMLYDDSCKYFGEDTESASEYLSIAYTQQPKLARRSALPYRKWSFKKLLPPTPMGFLAAGAPLLTAALSGSNEILQRGQDLGLTIPGLKSAQTAFEYDSEYCSAISFCSASMLKTYEFLSLCAKPDTSQVLGFDGSAPVVREGVAHLERCYKHVHTFLRGISHMAVLAVPGDFFIYHLQDPTLSVSCSSWWDDYLASTAGMRERSMRIRDSKEYLQSSLGLREATQGSAATRAYEALCHQEELLYGKASNFQREAQCTDSERHVCVNAAKMREAHHRAVMLDCSFLDLRGMVERACASGTSINFQVFAEDMEQENRFIKTLGEPSPRAAPGVPAAMPAAWAAAPMPLPAAPVMAPAPEHLPGAPLAVPAEPGRGAAPRSPLRISNAAGTKALGASSAAHAGSSKAADASQLGTACHSAKPAAGEAPAAAGACSPHHAVPTDAGIRTRSASRKQAAKQH